MARKENVLFGFILGSSPMQISSHTSVYISSAGLWWQTSTDTGRLEVGGQMSGDLKSSQRRTFLRYRTTERMQEQCLRVGRDAGGSMTVWGWFGDGQPGDCSRVEENLRKEIHQRVFQHKLQPVDGTWSGTVFKHTSKVCRQYWKDERADRSLPAMEELLQLNPPELLQNEVRSDQIPLTVGEPQICHTLRSTITVSHNTMRGWQHILFTGYTSCLDSFHVFLLSCLIVWTAVVWLLLEFINSRLVGILHSPPLLQLLNTDGKIQKWRFDHNHRKWCC